MAVLEPEDNESKHPSGKIEDILETIDTKKLSLEKQISYFKYSLEIDKLNSMQVKDIAKHFLFLYLYTQQTISDIAKINLAP